MPNIPKPEGFTGGQPDCGVLRTFDGHRAVNLETDSDLAGDLEWRSNTRYNDDVDAGTQDYGRGHG